MVYSVQWLMGSTSFTVMGTPGTPVTIHARAHVDFTVRHIPTTTSTTEAATIRIRSNDPAAPVVDLLATGARGSGALEIVIANHGSFGNVCLDSFADETLTINNSGPCPLSILNISSSTGIQCAQHYLLAADCKCGRINRCGDPLSADQALIIADSGTLVSAHT